MVFLPLAEKQAIERVALPFQLRNLVEIVLLQVRTGPHAHLSVIWPSHWNPLAAQPSAGVEDHLLALRENSY